MKHFCVLMTLVLGHVLALSEDSFKQHVNRTNCMLKQLKKGQLDEIVTFYVMDSMDIKAVTSLLAAPTSVFKDGDGEYPDNLGAYEEHILGRMKKFGKNPGALSTNLNHVTLSGMGKDRRNKIKESVLRLLQAVEGTIQSAAFGVQQRCRLMALFVNVRAPENHICHCSAVESVFNHNNCLLKLNESHEQGIVYRMWDDGYYYQVVVGSNRKGAKLTPIPEPPCLSCSLC